MKRTVVPANGPIRMPAHVRARLAWKEGTPLIWSVTPDGCVIITPKDLHLEDVCGMLRVPVPLPATLDEVSPFR